MHSAIARATSPNPLFPCSHGALAAPRPIGTRSITDFGIVVTRGGWRVTGKDKIFAWRGSTSSFKCWLLSPPRIKGNVGYARRVGEIKMGWPWSPQGEESSLSKPGHTLIQPIPNRPERLGWRKHRISVWPVWGTWRPVKE